MKSLTLSRDFFTAIAPVLMLCVRNCELSQKNKKEFIEILGVAGCCLVITDLQNNESKQQLSCVQNAFF